MNARTWYDLGYRFAPRLPWELGPREELVDLVTRRRLRPGRVLDLGCGSGANAVFLARHGFEVVGVDFAPAALAKARSAAAAAEVDLELVEADLTDLSASSLGTFDLLVDYGTLDDLPPDGRDRYVANVLPLAAPKSQFLLWCFEWPPRRRDRLLRLHPLVPGEVDRRFGERYEIERIAGTAPDLRRLVAAYATYLMTRRSTPTRAEVPAA